MTDKSNGTGTALKSRTRLNEPAATSNDDNIALAAEINQLHSEILEHEKTATEARRASVRKALKIGGMLATVKNDLPHGQYEAWVKANCTFKVPTAQKYHQLFEERNRADPKFRETVFGQNLTIQNTIDRLVEERLRREGKPKPKKPDRKPEESEGNTADPSERNGKDNGNEVETSADESTSAAETVGDQQIALIATIPACPDCRKIISKLGMAEWLRLRGFDA